MLKEDGMTFEWVETEKSLRGGGWWIHQLGALELRHRERGFVSRDAPTGYEDIGIRPSQRGWIVQ